MANVSPADLALSVTLDIQPSTFAVGDDVRIILAVRSLAPAPITICAHRTILDRDLAQHYTNFTCLDITDATPAAIQLQLRKCLKRRSLSRGKGDTDARYFHTLEPGVEVRFEDQFTLSDRTPDREDTPPERRKSVLPGHKYRFGVSDGQDVPLWWFGRREDVMAEPDASESWLLDPSGPPLRLVDVQPVEFEVRDV